MKIVRLNFSTPLHISNARSDYSISESIIHSDTLYSAFIESWNTLDIGKETLSKIIEDLPFAISSMFPYTTDRTTNEMVYFLPKPASFKPNVPIDLSKKVKKIEYVDTHKFKIYQEEGRIDLNQNDLKGIYLSGNDIDKDFIKRDTLTRVSISKEKQPQPYYTERIYFKDGSGLYFLLVTENNEITSLVEKALKYLSFEGIGTDRNVGNGKFNFIIQDFNDQFYLNNINTNYSLNLSLYSPESHELFVSELDEKTYFNLQTRGGWITTPCFQTLRKKQTRMIGEGSVLKKKYGISGKVVDLTPDKTKLPPEMQNIHNIYRIGKSLWIPVKL